MVLKIKPLCLIHLPLNDAYEFQYAQNLTTKDILLSIKQEKIGVIILRKIKHFMKTLTFKIRRVEIFALSLLEFKKQSK
jgi:hypothetical protein